MTDTAETPASAAPPREDLPTESADKAAPAPVDGASEEATTAATNGEAEAPAASADASVQPADAAADLTSDTKDAETGASGGLEVIQGLNEAAAPVASTNGTANAANKKEKRKSSAGVPEHKKKNLNRKKSMPDLHLNVEPGQYWFCVMKGYKPWPAIVCDEEMLPESLLMKRPVSAMRPDGTYRDDFMEGGKSVRDRRYPVMFLGTNEFAWQVNTDLLPLDMDELKKSVENGESAGKTKQLWSAYEVAAEEHDLEYFKGMLVEHEKTLMELQKDAEEKEQKKTESAEKKAKRKTTAAADDDVEMEDAAPEEDAPKKVKKSNKRKAEKEGEPEAEDKATKTPKKLKIKAPAAPETDLAAKPKKTPKPKKPKAEAEAAKPAKPTEPELTPEQALEKKQKTILFLRHKLQKGFLSRDQAPKADEMPLMSDNLTQLQTYPDLEASIIKATKINKVLKGMLKLATIPREEEFGFKKRCAELLAKWNTALSADDSTAGEPVATNGVNHDEKAKSESVVPSVEPTAAADAEVKADEMMEDTPTLVEAAATE